MQVGVGLIDKRQEGAAMAHFIVTKVSARKFPVFWQCQRNIVGMISGGRGLQVGDIVACDHGSTCFRAMVKKLRRVGRNLVVRLSRR